MISQTYMNGIILPFVQFVDNKFQSTYLLRNVSIIYFFE